MNEQTTKKRGTGDNLNSLVRCPDCGGEIAVDFTPGFNVKKSYERVCYACGWFDKERYATREKAESQNDLHQLPETNEGE